MKFVIETEQVIRRKYEVEAPGHVSARDFLMASASEREQYRHWQAAESERVVAMQRVTRLPKPESEAS